MLEMTRQTEPAPVPPADDTGGRIAEIQPSAYTGGTTAQTSPAATPGGMTAQISPASAPTGTTEQTPPTAPTQNLPAGQPTTPAAPPDSSSPPTARTEPASAKTPSEPAPAQSPVSPASPPAPAEAQTGQTPPGLLSEPTGEEFPPLPDFAALAVVGEDTLREATRRYAEAIEGYVARQVERRAAPLIVEHQAQLEGAAAREKLSKSPEYEGFADNLERIETIIEKIRLLRSLPAEERYILAYLIDRGQRAGTRPTGQELVDALLADREAMRLYEARRLSELERGAALPVFTSEGGRAMPANLPKKPKNIEQAGRAARKYFGL